MLREKTVHYYKQGYNCSQCLLKAAEQVYRINFDDYTLDMCAGINNGFGIGGMCSVLVAGIMLFGVLFDADTVKHMRIRLLNDCTDRFGAINCTVIKKQRKSGLLCEDIIGELSDIIENIIEETYDR